jgi:hypothetical protein
VPAKSREVGELAEIPNPLAQPRTRPGKKVTWLLNQLSPTISPDPNLSLPLSHPSMTPPTVNLAGWERGPGGEGPN